MGIEIVREAERRRITGISRVSQWRLEQEGRGARRVKLGAHSVGWVRSELEEQVASLLAARDASSQHAISVPTAKLEVTQTKAKLERSSPAKRRPKAKRTPSN